MSKYNSLFDKVEAFEKIAVFGNRSSFLEALSQEFSSVEAQLAPAVTNLYNAVQSWIKSNAEVQSDVPGRSPGLPAGMRNPFQILISIFRNKTYDLDTLPVLKNAVKNLMTVSNLGNAGANAVSSWNRIVFPQASHVADLADKQFKFLQNWQHQNESLEDAPKAVPATTQPAAKPVNKPQTVSQKTKAIADSLVRKVDSLSEGPERTKQLLGINNDVKELQRIYKELQHNPGLSDYFTRLNIVDAINKAYRVLDHTDLQTVVSLGPNRQGVPDSPDSILG